ncbi:MAG: leucyl aminopeptidase family protein [Pseudomonadota bacterium]
MTNLHDHAMRAADALLPAASRRKTIPITLASSTSSRAELDMLTSAERTWLKASGFSFAPGDVMLLPDEKGDLARVICGVDPAVAIEHESDPAASIALGAIASRLPAGDYHFESELDDDAMTSLAWALSTYSFESCRSGDTKPVPRLKVSSDTNIETLKAQANGTFFGRDLINTPANLLGPDELEAAATTLAKAFKAKISVIAGDDLLEQNFPMIHAVGRASPRAPRLIDIQWGKKTAPTVTLVGKGVVFDTGGLNIKPGNSMALMKKDMGGAATALALAHMVMAAKLPVRLRVLIPCVENSVSGNAYRPGDVLTSRDGMTVEIGNTDAEGRLVLADALSLADEDAPSTLLCFATLTGSARVALGPDLPPLYATTDELAEHILTHGAAMGDPLWRMPFWTPYEQTLASAVADVSHISQGPFAGSITAALFLQRFVKQTTNFAHIDMYGWVPAPKAAQPKGGEPQTARAIFSWLSKTCESADGQNI